MLKVKGSIGQRATLHLKG